MKMFRLVALMLTVLSGVMLCGCRSGSEQVPGRVENRAWIIRVRSECMVPEYPKTFFVTMSTRSSAPAYNAEVKKYIENGLSYIGFELVPAGTPGALKVVADFNIVKSRRMTTYCTMAAYLDDRLCWKTEASCGSKVVDCRNFLPGLVAASLPGVGRQERVTIRLANYPQYLEAVYGK